MSKLITSDVNITRNNKRTVANLYDLRSFNDAAACVRNDFTYSKDHVVKMANLMIDDHAMANYQKDASAGLLLPRQLEYISTTIYEQKFAELSFLSQGGIAVNNEGGVAEVITKLKKGITGDFADAGNSSNTDGKISLTTEDDTISVYMKKAESSWSEIELEQAQLANRNLVGDFIGAHNTRYNQSIDSIGYVGTDKVDGLLNHSSFTVDAATGVFTGLTAIQMYNDIADLVVAQRGAVLNDPVFSADKVAISPVRYNLLSRTILDTAGGTTTVREALEKNLNIQFVLTFRAATAGTGGVQVAVAYSSDARAMVMRIPTQLRVSNIYQKGFDSYVESLFRIGGLDVIEAASGRILEDI